MARVRVLRSARGGAFTLIELVVVVAVLATLAAAAAVQLARARIIANEQVGLTSVRLIAKSSQFFLLARNVYPADLTELGPPVSDPPYLEEALRIGNPPVKHGYAFVYARPTPTAFTLNANPQTHGVTGVQHFYTDQTFAIHATDANRDANTSDPIIP